MDHPELRNDSDVYYGISSDSVEIDASNGKINAVLNLASESDGSVA